MIFNTNQKGSTHMSHTQEALTTAFFNDAPCQIVYRDKAGRWTERTVEIAELKRDHIIAKCEMRNEAYRRFNLNTITDASPISPPAARAGR